MTKEYCWLAVPNNDDLVQYVVATTQFHGEVVPPSNETHNFYEVSATKREEYEQLCLQRRLKYDRRNNHAFAI